MHETLPVSSKNSEVLKKAFLFAILLVGAYLRIANYQYCPTGHYSLPYLKLSLDIVDGISYPLQGPRLGFLDAFHGPAAYYLIAIPLFFSKNPVVPYIFIGLVNVLAIYVTYRIGKDFFSETAGFVAAIILAVDPTILMFTKDVADKGLTMIFVTLAYYCFFRIMSGKNSRFAWLVFPIVITTGVQVHMQLDLILALAVLQFFYSRPAVHWKYLAVGCLLAVIPVMPQIYHDLTRDNSHFLAFFRALLEYGTDHSSMPDSMMNRKPSLLLNFTTTFGVLFYLYLLSIAHIAVTRVVVMKNGLHLSDRDKRIISLFIFATVSFLVFSRHLNQNLLRHFTSYTPMTLIIGVSVSELLRPAREIRSAPGKALRVVYAAGVMIFFAGILVLYSIKAYGYTLYYVRPVPTEFFNRFGKVMCTDIYMDNCEEVMDQALDAFSRTSYKYRRQQYGVLYHDLDIDAKTFIWNMHGTGYYMLLGDDGHLFRTMKPGDPASGAGNYHYLIEGRDFIEKLAGFTIYNRIEYIDDMGVMQYTSAIDYPSITYSYFGGDVREDEESPRPWREYYAGSGDRQELDRVASDEHLHWKMDWAHPGITLNGNVARPAGSPPLLFVVDVFFRDRVDQLAGPDRPLDIELSFNGIPVEYSARWYEGVMLFGESYKMCYLLEPDSFAAANTFTVTADMQYPEDTFFFDFYAIPLKTDSMPDL